MSAMKLLARKGLVQRAVKAANGSREAQNENHLVLMSCAALIVGDDDAAREDGCEAALAWLNTLGVRNSEARKGATWLTGFFRIGIEHDAKEFTKVRFKPNSEKADDMAGAEATPYWVVAAKASDDEAAKVSPDDVRKIIAAANKRLDAVINGNATPTAKRLASKARKALLDC